jgi:hypothetical protein
MLRIIAVLFALCTLAGSSRAQSLGQPINTTFIAEDLQTRPGKLEVDPASHTVLRFFDEVTFAFSRRSDILKAVPKGNDIVLYAMAQKAQTDLSVLVDGRWHFFIVKINQGAGLKFYEVRSRGGNSSAKLSPVHPAVNPSPQAAPTSSPTAQGSIALVSPQWLRCSFKILSSSASEIIMSYSLENTGQERLIVSPSSLRVLRDGQLLEFKLEQHHGSLLEPNTSFFGLIHIKAPKGTLRLEWNLRLLTTLELIRLEANLP